MKIDVSLLDGVLNEYKSIPGSLITILQKTQEIYGYLPIEVQPMIADAMEIPLEKVYGVVTFYAQFSINPKGKYKISVCLGTACYVKGSGNIFNKLQEKLGLPVFLDRDVNFLLMNDMKKLKIDNNKTVLGFYVGTGFGNAICINGELYAGKNGAAGELGHIPFYEIDEECTCGNIGCSETRCSGKRLEFIASKYFDDVAIRNVFKYHGNSPILTKFVRDLAIPIATEINILDPDYSIIAGGVVFMEGFPKDILIEAIHEKVRKPYPEKNLEILFSEHDQQSGIYGSGIFAHEKIKGIN